MCGRFTLFVTPDELEERFGVEVPASYAPSYNVSPGERILAIDDDGAALREWGLVPHWADDPGEGGHVNARAETVEERPSFQTAVARRRCLVPVDGFYEWTDATDSRPYRFAREDDRPFALAGIWARWAGRREQAGLDDFAGAADGPEPEVLETVAICTTEAREPVADVHDRMPVVLPEDRERAWLAAEDAETRASILASPSADGLRAYPVSTAVNDPSRDAPELIEPVDG